MSDPTSIDEVLLATAELLSRPDAPSVSDVQVLNELRWPTLREGEVRSLLMQLIDDGYLRGPKGGPLRGDNQVLAVDVLGVTAPGEDRIAQLRRPAHPLLSQEQLRFMSLIFDHFSRTGEWPIVAHLQRDLARKGDRFDLAGVNIPSELGFRDAGIRTAGLTIRGAFEIAPASQEVADFAIAMRVCCELYLNEDKPKLTSTALREQFGMDELRLKKLHTLLQTDPFLTAGGGSSGESNWDLIVWDERCHYFVGAETTADYVATADRLRGAGGPVVGQGMSSAFAPLNQQLEERVRAANAILGRATWERNEETQDAPIPDELRHPLADADVDVAAVAAHLHPRIRDACYQLVVHDHYPSAVLKASIALRDLLREKSGLIGPDFDDLAGQALSPKSPRLVVTDVTSDTGRSLQRGTMLLAQGVFAAMRNVVAHNDVSIPPAEALEMLATISLVARQIDAAHLTTIASTNEEP